MKAPLDEETEGEPPCVFGYCMGQAMEGEPDFVNDNDCLLVTVVEDDPTFDRLYVVWAHIAGVCEVMGTKETDDTDTVFDTFAAIVTRKYGEPATCVDEGKLWQQPRAGIENILITSSETGGISDLHLRQPRRLFGRNAGWLGGKVLGDGEPPSSERETKKQWPSKRRNLRIEQAPAAWPQNRISTHRRLVVA